MSEDTSTVLSRANGTTSGPLQPLTPVEEGESPESFDDTRGQSVPSRTPSGSIRPSFPTKLKSARLMRTPVKDQSTLLTEIAGSEQADDDVEADIFFDEDYDSFDETDIFEDIIKPDGEVIGQEEEDDPGILSDETELEVDIEGILNPDRVIHDTTGKTKYIRACQRETTTPISLFLHKIQQKHFIMRYRGLGPNGAKALSVPLESNTTIERLDLEGNSIEARGAVYLANMLKENYYISEMMLAENKIGNQGVKALCDVLQDYHTVTKLDVSGNAIDDAAAPFLQEMLKKNSSLKHLNLSHNSIGNVGAKMFKEVLSDNESLESLDLSWNEIRTQGMIWLAEGIQENIGLKHLNVCMNGMCLEGAREMGKALKQNRSLLELDISYNRIPLDACVFIAAGVQANDTLQTLRMGSNPLSDDGSLAMLTALEKNDSTALTCLDFSNIVVTGAFERLRMKLTQEKQVRVIHGGVVGSTLDVALDVDFTDSVSMIDPLEAFRRDPMSKVKQYVQAAGLRMLDLFKQFDKDNSMTVTKAEFVKGMTKADLGLSADQIDILISRMDKDGDGEIDFGELICSDKEYREKQREMKKLQLQLERRNKSPQDKDNESTTSS